MKYEQPVITQREHHGESTESHPAYAQISACRTTCSGNGQVLYGSDFGHTGFITIRIKRSEMHRSLSRDWYFGREEYIDVCLSEAQWAGFISTLNVGDGVPCTLRYLNGKDVPQIPEIKKRNDQFDKELRDHLVKVETQLETLRLSILGDSKITGKRKDELLNMLLHATNNLTPNLSFVAEQFGEHMEAVTESAKIEVAAYIQGAISRAGLQALQSGEPLLQLSEGEKEIENG